MEFLLDSERVNVCRKIICPCSLFYYFFLPVSDNPVFSCMLLSVNFNYPFRCILWLFPALIAFIHGSGGIRHNITDSEKARNLWYQQQKGIPRYRCTISSSLVYLQRNVLKKYGWAFCSSLGIPRSQTSSGYKKRHKNYMVLVRNLQVQCSLLYLACFSYCVCGFSGMRFEGADSSDCFSSKVGLSWAALDVPFALGTAQGCRDALPKMINTVPAIKQTTAMTIHTIRHSSQEP